jgi:hypothetical protein
MSRLLLFVCLFAPVMAFADDAETAKSDMYQFAYANHKGTKEGNFGGNLVATDPAQCDAAVKRGNAAGIKPSEPFNTDDGQMLWKRAPEVCAQYAKIYALNKVIESLEESWKSIEAFSSLTRPDGSPDPSVRGDAYRASVEQAKKCVKIIDEAVGKGVISDQKYAPTGNDNEKQYTLVETKKRCSDWVSWGSGAAKADDDRAAAEIAALKAKYGKFGITSDRLNYLVKYGHQPVYGAGCGELSGKGLKNAPAFYQLSQDDLAWIVYKTTFKGDKQTSYTSKRYRKDGNWYCK